VQIRIIVIILISILILESLSSFFIYFDEGKVVNIKDLFLNMPEDFPPNFYIILLRAKNPHFYNFIYHLLVKDLYFYNQLSKYKLIEFKGFKVRDDIQFYGKSDMLCLMLSFWAYSNRLKFIDDFKIGIIGDVSEEGKVLPVLGINNKYSIALSENLNVLILPFQNEKDLNKKKGDLYCIFVNDIEEAKKNLLKFSVPEVVNIR